MSFTKALAAQAERIQAALDTHLKTLPASDVAEGMAHALNGGKRLRGFLVLESAALHGLDPDAAMPAASAIEALHAYSLVHDDLPCMDDDALRRGQPTVHVKWDEATAVLVGDALQSMAFELIASCEAPAERRLSLVRSLAVASGAQGMVLGQATDIAAEAAETPLDLDAIGALQALKTGALIEWSACAGPRLAGADTRPMRVYSRALGLAFQIADDVLDVEGDEAKTGKRLHKDADAGKATYVSLLGLEAAKAKARALVAEAEAALAPYGREAQSLRDAAQFVISRDR